MKRYFYLFFLLFAAGFLFWQKNNLIFRYKYLTASRCETPLTYRLGHLDPEYQTTASAFLVKVKQGEDIWGRAYGQDLFVFDPQGELVVNLVYSERQSALDKLESFQGELESGKGSLEQKIAEFENLSADFEARVEKFNAEVAYWMDQGGAPPGVYEELIARQEGLKKEQTRLNAMAQDLNLTVKNYNFQVGEFNREIMDYNLLVQQRPEAGLYDGFAPQIDIYLTVSEEELIHTLAHEFGHALGLGHVDNPEAIMYPYSSEVLTPSAEEVALVQGICASSRFEVWLGRQQAKLNQFLTDLFDSF